MLVCYNVIRVKINNNLYDEQNIPKKKFLLVISGNKGNHIEFDAQH